MRLQAVDDVHSLAGQAMARYGLAGVAVAVVRPGAPRAVDCRGVADTRTARLVEADTVFRIASVTKTMTGIGLMQLRESGRFGLDDPVNEYLKSFRIESPPGWPDVTFRHLLTHTAGIGQIPRLSDVVHPAAFGIDEPGSGGVDLAALYRGALRPEIPAGGKWAYANHGFAVAGQLVQDISGVPLPEYLRDRVFDPLGMSRTDYLRTDRVAGDVGTGYRVRKGQLRPVRDYDRSLLGPGAVRSTVSDMATYAEALLRTGAGQEGLILRQETLTEMWAPQFSPDPRVPGMGLAFFLHDFDGRRVVGHDGNLPGFASALLLAPDDQAGVVVLTNTARPFGAHLLAEAILRSELGLPAAGSRLPRPDVPERPETWDELVGYYAPGPGLLTNVRTWQLVGGEVQVLVRGERLVARALSPLRGLRRGARLHSVDRHDPTSFELNAGGMVVPVVFRREGDGQIMCLGHPMLSSLRSRPWWRSSRPRVRALAAVGVATAAFTLWRALRGR
jgi:CubicO group peptidase (beta-lactamase class C family)